MHGPDVSAWRHALIDNLLCADGCRVLCLDGTMKIAMGLRRYETTILRREEGIVHNRLGDNTCVLPIRTLESGLLDLAVVPHGSKPCHVVAALEGAMRGALVGGRQRECRIVLYCTPFFPWTTRSSAGHLSPALEVRGCGIESKVSGVTDAPPSGEKVQRGTASGLTARPVHAFQRRRYASDGRAGAVFLHPPL